MHTIEIKPENTAALILSGGKAQRMGGTDKGLILLNNHSLIWYVLNILPKQIAWKAISANRSLDEYAKFGVPVFCDDEIWRDMGPLAGIVSNIKHLPANIKALQILPCDTPFLPNDLIKKLCQKLNEKTENMLCYASTNDGDHPSVLLIKIAALKKLPNYLRQGGRKLHSYLDLFPSASVFFNDSKAFTNINDLYTLREQEIKTE